MIEIKYTNTIDEIKEGFMGIFKKYSVRRSVLYSFAFLIAVILGVDFIIKNPSGFSGYALVIVGVSMIISQWLRPFMVRNRLVKALNGLYEETYVAKFYDDRIEIDTEIVMSENEETEVIAISKFGTEKVDNPEIIEKVMNEEKEKPPAKHDVSIINIATEELCSEESETIFRLYVNRGLVYIFPKRCMNDEQIKKLSEYFSEKAI